MPNIIKSPAGGAYGLWFKDNCARIKAGLRTEEFAGNVSVPVIAKRASQMWKELPQEEKDPWQKVFDEKAKLFQQYKEFKRKWEVKMIEADKVAQNQGLKKKRRGTDKDDPQAGRAAKKIRFAVGGDLQVAPGDDDWKRFTPSMINQEFCMSRTWCDGKGGQCQKKRCAHSDFCKLHSTKQSHGRVDGPIPKDKLIEFARMHVAETEIVEESKSNEHASPSQQIASSTGGDTPAQSTTKKPDSHVGDVRAQAISSLQATCPVIQDVSAVMKKPSSCDGEVKPAEDIKPSEQAPSSLQVSCPAPGDSSKQEVTIKKPSSNIGNGRGQTALGEGIACKKGIAVKRDQKESRRAVLEVGSRVIRINTGAYGTITAHSVSANCDIYRVQFENRDVLWLTEDEVAGQAGKQRVPS
jgi:hypothetical protein